MHDRSIPHQAETLRRICMVAASLTIGTFIWFLLGDSDSLVAEEPPNLAPSAEQVLAEVAGIPVTESEVKSLVAEELEALEIERRRLMDTALEIRIRELMIEVAATEQGLSPVEFLVTEVDQKLDQVAQVDVDAYYRREGIDDPQAAVEGEIRRRLRMEAFIQELESRPDLDRSRERSKS